jgi:hypothetical protein
MLVYSHLKVQENIPQIKEIMAEFQDLTCEMETRYEHKWHHHKFLLVIVVNGAYLRIKKLGRYRALGSIRQIFGRFLVKEKILHADSYDRFVLRGKHSVAISLTQVDT